MKIAASTRVENDVYERIERLAKADKRTVANIIEICIEGFLPGMEREVLGPDFAGKPPKPSTGHGGPNQEEAA